MTIEMTAAAYRKMIGAPDIGLATQEVPSVRPEADEVIIAIPGQPCYSLSPNSRKHYMVKARDAKEAKARGFIACMGLPRVSGPVVIEWRIFLAKGVKLRDWDNMVPCLKPILDSFVISGVIDGDSPDIVRDATIEQFIWLDHYALTGKIVAIIRRAS